MIGLVSMPHTPCRHVVNFLTSTFGPDYLSNEIKQVVAITGTVAIILLVNFVLGSLSQPQPDTHRQRARTAGAGTGRSDMGGSGGVRR